MPVIVSLLRGVNVGGYNQVSMEKLRALYATLGFEDSRSYIQSGNLVFWTKKSDLPSLAKTIEQAIEKKFGVRSSVILRTADEMRDVVAKNPFANRADVPPNKLIVTFLASDPGAAARKTVLAIPADPEEVCAEGRELYIYFPNGMGRTKLPMARIEKMLGTPGTARNWNSVLKLLAMSEELEQHRG